MRERLQDRRGQLGDVGERVLIRAAWSVGMGVGTGTGVGTGVGTSEDASARVARGASAEESWCRGARERVRLVNGTPLTRTAMCAVLTWCTVLPSLRTTNERTTDSTLSNRPRRTIAGALRTVEALRLFQEPLEPAAVEPDVLELLEYAAPVRLGVVRELRALDEREDDRVLEAREDCADAVERERVAAQDEVLLGKRDAGHRL